MSVVRDTPLHTRLGFINAHDVVRYAVERGAGPAVYLAYRPQQSGRSSTSPAWQAIGTDHQTDPDGPFYNHGYKTFPVSRSRGGRAGALEAAKAWGAERYGCEWAKVKHARNVWFPKPVADLVNQALRDAERAAR